MKDSGFDSHDGKSDFFISHDRHVNSFCFFQMILVRLVSEERAGKSLGRFVNLNESTYMDMGLGNGVIFYYNFIITYLNIIKPLFFII